MRQIAISASSRVRERELGVHPVATRCADPRGDRGAQTNAGADLLRLGEVLMRVRIVMMTHPCRLYAAVSERGSCAARTVNKVATTASPPYPKAICGSEKVFESSPEMRLGKAAPL
jgi:hypothetical protein